MPDLLAAALIRLYAEALKEHVPPLTNAARQQRAENDIARLLAAVAAAGLRLTLGGLVNDQTPLDLEE